MLVILGELNAMRSSPVIFARAKHMRREPTKAEAKLWGALRNRRLGGLKFYRQVPIGPYVVDFVNKELGFVVEVDGATHGDELAVRHDQKRKVFLATKGLFIHRVDNAQIFSNIGSVLDGIHAVLHECAAKGPHPALRATFSRGEGTV